MKPNSRQKLAPTWLIVTHLLGAAVMLYFVSDPTLQPVNTQVAASSLTISPGVNPDINVAELGAPVVSKPSPVNR